LKLLKGIKDPSTYMRMTDYNRPIALLENKNGWKITAFLK